MEDVTEVTADLLHQIQMKSAIRNLGKELPVETKGKINLVLKETNHHLGELEDWVHINKKDSVFASLHKVNECIEKLNQKIIHDTWS